MDKTKKQFNWRSVLDNLTELFYLSTIFLVPIYFAVFLETDNVFETNKIFLLRILLALLLALTLIRELFFPSTVIYRLKKVFKLYLIPLLFIIFLAASSLFSSYPALSFFGALDRQQGFLSYLLYFLFFVLLSFNLMVLKSRNPNLFSGCVKRLIVWISLSGLLVSIYAILQFLGIDYYHWQEQAVYTRRAFSSLGQPNFLASFLLLVIPLATYLIYISQKMIVKLFFGFILVLNLLALIASSSRGSLVALFLVLAGIFLYLFFSKTLKWKQSVKIFLFVLASVLSIAFGFLLEKAIPGRVSSLFDFKAGSVSARVDFYQAATSAISQKPLFGYGLDNLYSAFLPYYQTSWGVHGDIGQVPDRAHNLILDILMSVGLVGLLFYLALYVYFFWLALKLFKQEKWKYLSLSLALASLLYFLSLLFSFSVVTTEFYFFVFLALLLSLNYQEESQYVERKIKKIFKVLVSLLAIAISAFIIYFSSTSLLANYHFAGARLSLSQGQISESLTFLDYVDANHLNSADRAAYANTYSYWLINIYPQNELVIDYLIKERLNIALNDLRDNSPQNMLSKARILSVLARHDEAIVYVNKVRAISPQWPMAILASAKIYEEAALLSEAISSYNYLLETLPSVNDDALNANHLKVLRDYRQEAFVSLAEIYFSQLDYGQAASYYRLAYLEKPLNHDLLKKIADCLYLQGDFSQALLEVQKAMKLSPDDYTWPLLASYLYTELGELEQADLWRAKAIDLGFVEKN